MLLLVYHHLGDSWKSAREALTSPLLCFTTGFPGAPKGSPLQLFPNGSNAVHRCGVIGPWEWDLKRLTASVNVAGRQNGLNRSERAAAVRQCVKGYRFNARRLQDMGVLDIWYLHAYPGKENPIVKADPKSKAVFRKTLAKAMHTDNRALMPKVADRKGNGKWTFRDDPPVLTRVDKATKRKVIDALNRYSLTLPRERRLMLGRYHVADVAHRIVGVGSVGTRAYLVLLFGNG